MARWGKCDCKELKDFAKQLEHLQDTDFDKVCRTAANEIAAVLLNKVKKRTPVGVKPTLEGPRTAKVTSASGKKRTMLTKTGEIYERYWSGYKGGTLRDAWTVLPVEKRGKDYVVTVINPTEYASYVEYGHRQTPGRYVPALGKRLKANWVKGRFMLTISGMEVKKLAPKLLEKAVYEALKGGFDGK